MKVESANRKPVTHLVQPVNDTATIVTTHLQARQCPVEITNAIVDWFDGQALSFLDMVEGTTVCPHDGFLYDPHSQLAIASRPGLFDADSDLICVINWVVENRGRILVPLAFEYRNSAVVSVRRALICPLNSNSRSILSVIPF